MTKFEIPEGIEELNGFGNMLNQLLQFLKKETEFKPEKRFIDSAKILDMISIAADDIQKSLSYEQKKLKSIKSTLK